MPGKIKVKVLAGRNLPVMDRASDTTDAFVEIKFGGVTHKTDVCRKSLNPHWSSTEWYRFEVDESELQDEPLQLRLMDHDTYSANDAIGKVVISLAPLLAREANNAKGATAPPGGAVLSGWIPVFDTMHGIRGELNVIVKVELFSDFNKYKTSSCGVQFFHCPMIPPGYKATSIHGFVEELVVNDDPEYQWIDKIRTPRASNEARQVAFIKLSNQVQRLVGLKAAELGANAVVGYQQEFDLEGEAGVVARAIGTAVSITPLPTPSQPVNMMSCTQQQLQKCLDILATDGESVTDLSQYYKNHQEELQKMITLLNPKGLSMLDSQEILDDDDEKIELVRQSSLNSYAGSVSLYQDDFVSRNSLRNLSEDQIDLNRLLNRKEDDDSDSSGPIQKIKKLKTNFFTKRFTKRKGDKKEEKQDDTVSLKSNSSDTSRISLYDIKNEFKKFKRLKKPKFRKTCNKEDEGEGMASILARSVIHARTTLACITETQDSQAENSPCSTMRRKSDLESNVHNDDDNSKKIPDQEKVEDTKKVPEIQFSSLKNISSEDLIGREPRVRRISESCPTSPMAGRSDNLLKLPGDKGYFGSVSSALSGESSIYSSSEEEDESSDLKTDTDETLETTSSIVKSVLKYESDPAFIAQMDRKLTVLQNTPPKISESLLADFDKRATGTIELANNKVEASEAPEKEANEIESKVEKAEETVVPIKQLVTNEPSTSTKEVETCVPKPNSHYIKLHNPFAHRKTSASISCPSSPVEKHNFVYRSSKRIKDKISKISNSNMIKSISHISLFPKKKESKTVSQSGSTSDVPSYPSRCPSETVLGSHFLSYSDLLGLDKERIQANKLCKSDEIGNSKFSMYIGSEPVSRCSITGLSHPHSRDEQDHKKDKHSLKPTGLIHTAMETMLIDKIESLLIPTSPEIDVNTKFFDDVSERLEEHKNSGAAMRHLQSTTGSTTPRIVAVTPKRLSEDLTTKIDKLVDKKHQEESKGLVHTAMETILMEKAQAVLPDTTEGIHTTEWHEDYDSEKLRAMQKKKESRGSINILMDKVHFHPHFFHHKKDGSSHDIKSGGLIQAAMQTMLIDRAQSMMPDTPEPIPIHTEPDFGEIGKHHKHHDHAKEHSHIKDKESTGLVHSALQTMLIDNVQSVLPDSDQPIPIRTERDFGKEFHENRGHAKEKESTGLVHSALQTMLIDNIQSVLPDSDEPIPIRTEPVFDDTKSQKSLGNDKESTGLVHSALQTMLIDNIQSVLPDSDEPVPIRTETVYDDTKSQKSLGNDKESTGLVHSALQTILIDNIQSVLPDSDRPVPIRTEPVFDDTKSQKSIGNDKESTGLVHSALQTMLIDNIQSVLPDLDKPVPIRTEPVFDDTKSQKSIGNDKESTGLVHSALQTMLIDNIQSVLPDSDEPVPIRTETVYDDTKSQKSLGNGKGLVHSALQTILIDNIQSVLPDSDKPVPIRTEPVFDDTKSQKSIGNDKESTGLVHSALQTMLIDNIQSVLPNSDEPVPIRTEPVFDHSKSQKSHGKDKESTGFAHSALQTMLIDNVQSVLPNSDKPIPINLDSDTERKRNDDKINATGLVHSAMETMLLDKAQALINPKAMNVECVSENKDIEALVLETHKEEKGLVNTAMETILIDRMQTMFPKAIEANIEKKHVGAIQDSDNELKSIGLVKNAMQTILIDKASTVLATTETDETRKHLSESADNEFLIEVDNSTLKSWSKDSKDGTSESIQEIKGVKQQKKTKVKNKEFAKNKDTDGRNKVIVKQKKETENRNKGRTKQKKAFEERKKHFTRQDSVHSNTSDKMSNEPNTHKVTKALLQHFHPIHSGGLETIPSEECNDSFDRSIDETNSTSAHTGVAADGIIRSDTASTPRVISTVEGSIDRTGETNRASVCDNSHAACRFDREREKDRDRSEKGSPKHARHESYSSREPPTQNPSLNASSTPMGIHRRSSDSDLSVTPKGGSLNNVGSGGGAILRPSMNSNNLDMLEYPFLTMTEYPPGFIVHIGGAVCARSVKLVDGGGESALRAAWWAELRTELRAHARALRCNAVIAYCDSAAICEDVCVLSASGTAVVINLDCDFNADIEAPITVANGKAPVEENEDSCSIAHVPYSPGAGPYRAELSTCGACRRARVPAVLLAACAKPSKLTAYPKSVTLTAVAARIRRAPPSAEPGARDISDQLPFLEYELHKLLLAKLRMQGANAIFSLKTQIAIGERCVMALASGTAVKLTALPPPTPPRIKASEKEKDALEMQKALWDTFTANKAANGYDVAGIADLTTIGVLPEVEREERPALDLCADKDACVLELDEAEDVETARALSKRRFHLQAFTNSLRPAPGAQPLAFTQVSRLRLVLAGGASGAGAGAAAERQVARALDGAAYKLRRLQPAALAAAFQLELPEDEIQLVVSGTAIPLADPSKPEPSENGHSAASQSSQHYSQNSQNSQSSQNSQTDGNDDDIFELDEEQMKPGLTAQEMVEDKSVVNGQVGSAVSLTCLGAGGARARRLCALRLLFVRETTAVRELGGLSGFLHTFTCEVLAILRAYTAALGGNALTSFYITQLMLQDNAHKNQGQCLLSVGGDVVHVSY